MGAAAPLKSLAAPVFIPASLVECADAALARLERLGDGSVSLPTGAQLLSERAVISGYFSQGRVSPGGSCRLLEARDGLIALNLARDEDWDLLPAWLEADVARDWDAVSAAVSSLDARALVERGREIGLAVALDAPANRSVGGALAPTSVAIHRGQGRSHGTPIRVIDLSSLWAGPLCSHLLHRMGAEVIKVESLHRPDGARRGPRAFFDLLNAGKASVALDFSTAEGRAQLRALIDSADIVIEASRPRALRQLGIDAEHYAQHKVWLSLTAYGRTPATENWIGYGDDVAVAAGLTHAVRQATGETQIVGDAIADPLTGIHAALAVWQARRPGLLDISLHATLSHLLSGGQSRTRKPLIPMAAQPLRTAQGQARELGADTIVQLREAARINAGETATQAEGEH
ncbi:MAG TPA: CoA transferase [Verrucomicrobiae bacterium]|nr:CoA transferase [Verrucomicrobiae bacterium]